MIEKDLIIKREKNNDGSSVHLYYHEELGLYVSYGLSAFYVTMVVDPMASYSELMGMPVVMLKKDDVLQLRQSMKIIEHQIHHYYLLQTKEKIGTSRWYNTWTEALRQHIR